jgi:hypothetical protein
MEALKANELRIGNWISNGAMPITAGFDQIRYAEIFQPIPLTPEWLERFGFEKFRLIKDGIVFDNSWLRINESMVAYWRGGFIGKIQHVNSLQNLYFALTGSELTLKN